MKLISLHAHRTVGDAETISTPVFVNAGGPLLNAVHKLLPGDDAMASEVASLCNNSLAGGANLDKSSALA